MARSGLFLQLSAKPPRLAFKEGFDLQPAQPLKLWQRIFTALVERCDQPLAPWADEESQRACRRRRPLARLRSDRRTGGRCQRVASLSVTALSEHIIGDKGHYAAHPQGTPLGNWYRMGSPLGVGTRAPDPRSAAIRDAVVDIIARRPHVPLTLDSRAAATSPASCPGDAKNGIGN
jgi:hypothetical protein